MIRRTAMILIGLIATMLIGAKLTTVNHAINKDFTFEGKPIHPGVIWEFEIWLSDGDPARVKTVDLESCTTSNKNFLPPRKDDDGWLTCRDGDPEPKDRDHYFSYKHLGVTSSGTHVLETESGGGGGTMRAMDIFLVRFGSEDYFQWKEGVERPEKNQRAVLSCIGQIVLGDRDDGAVEFNGDVLTVGKSRYRDKAVVYRLP